MTNNKFSITKTIAGWTGVLSIAATIVFMGIQIYIFLDESKITQQKHNEYLVNVLRMLDEVHQKQDQITTELARQTLQLEEIVVTGRDRFSQRENRFEELETMHTITWKNQLSLTSKIGDLQFVLGGHQSKHEE